MIAPCPPTNESSPEVRIPRSRQLRRTTPNRRYGHLPRLTSGQGRARRSSAAAEHPVAILRLFDANRAELWYTLLKKAIVKRKKEIQWHQH